MSLSQAFIIKKLEEIDGYINEVKDLLMFSNEEILSNRGRMRIAERLIQLIVDSMLDINNHIIKELKLESDDLQSTFYSLRNHGIFPEDFAFRIAPITGLRNRIVHRYDKLDEKLFIKTLRNEFEDFKMYVNIIGKYLETI